ncbi:hypothetical protein FQR65_LT06359 [Abscondita terminalis]|nr:hypothetical protein FQR65_LT06359 [Abscondita terminalis]
MSDLFAKINCTYCQEEINGLRVQCCICVDFDICLQCFASGAEIGPHRNDHSYKFVDHCAVSIFGSRGSWTGREELQLLEAIEICGFGIGILLANKLKHGAQMVEVRDEYVSRYLDGNIGKATWAEIANRRPIITDQTPEDRGPLSPLVTARLPPLDVTPEEARQLGYMSHRDDYDREYDMAAEQLVTSLQLNVLEDSNTEIALKLAQVDMYTRRLRERARRKRVVRDYQLVAKFFSNQRKEVKKLMTKDQKELRDRMRVFSQFLTAGEHERLIASIERERELRFRISELLRYRSLGLTTQEEAIHYEQHAAFQRQQQIRQNKAGSSGYAVSIPESQLKNGKSEVELSTIDKRSTWLQDAESEINSFNNSNFISQDNIAQPPLNGLPNGGLLSQHEIQLCSSLNLEPVQYTTLKTLIIQDHLVSNNMAKPNDPESQSSDISIREAVTQYLGTSGWLPGVVV